MAVKGWPLALVLCVVGAFIAAFIDAQPRRFQPITGQYVCTGTNPNGQKYTFTLKVEALEQVYGVEWSNESGGAMYRGVGLLHLGYFSVATGVFTPDGQVMLTAILYEVDASGTLHGWWTGSNGRVYEERCRRPGISA